MSLLKKITATAAVAAAAGTLVATEAYATEGYFQNAIGARSKGLAGAGVADGKDATAITLNPAGLVDAGRQFNGAVSLFMPFRKYTAGAPMGFAVPGSKKSKRNFFPVPNIAYSHPLSETTTFGISLSGNGGMNTRYGTNGGVGVFGATGDTGVDLTQVNISAGIGTRLGEFVSVGVAPIFAIQRFKAYGIAGFGGLSSDPANLSNRGYSYSVGAGVRVGAQVKVAENMRVGASYQSRTYMSRFKKYGGLFAQNGDFDIPANFQVGVAYDATPDLTLMFDIKHTLFSDVRSVGNPFTFFPPLGAGGGSGFGWKDVTTFKFGAEFDYSEDLTLRAGYSYNTQPIPGNQVLFNILAPAVSQHHITGGGSYKVNENSQVDFAVMFSPNTKVSGNGPTGAAQPLSIEMYQLEFTAGYTYHW